MIYKRKNDKVEFIKIFKLHPLEKKHSNENKNYNPLKGNIFKSILIKDW